MAFLRKQTSEGSIGLLYSIIQKCIRRGLEEECLYYSGILYKEGTPNSLRKRLVYVTNEDICNLKLAKEIMECKNCGHGCHCSHGSSCQSCECANCEH